MEKYSKGITEKGVDKVNTVLSSVPIIFIRLIRKDARCNRKFLDEYFHTIILEMGIRFPKKACHHLDTLKQIKQKTVPM